MEVETIWMIPDRGPIAYKNENDVVGVDIIFPGAWIVFGGLAHKNRVRWMFSG